MSAKKRMNEVKWSESKQHWYIAVQVTGKRKFFYSSIPGRKGKLMTRLNLTSGWSAVFLTILRFQGIRHNSSKGNRTPIVHMRPHSYSIQQYIICSFRMRVKVRKLSGNQVKCCISVVRAAAFRANPPSPWRMFREARKGPPVTRRGVPYHPSFPASHSSRAARQDSSVGFTQENSPPSVCL